MLLRLASESSAASVAVRRLGRRRVRCLSSSSTTTNTTLRDAAGDGHHLDAAKYKYNRFRQFSIFSSSKSTSYPFSTAVRQDDDDDDWSSEEDDEEALPVSAISMSDLVMRAESAVHFRKAQNIAPGSKQDPILELFRTTFLPHAEWKPYAHYCSDVPYTRNLVATDHETYTLILMCWNPNGSSPIHDHPCDGCWMNILDGTVRERRFVDAASSSSAAAPDLQLTSDRTFASDSCAYITDALGYHQVSNPSPIRPAASLHLYAPPIQTCRTFDDVTGESSVCRTRNYSEYGRVLVDAAAESYTVRTKEGAN